MAEPPRRGSILFLGPFPPPFGGIANHTRLLFESELSRRFTLHRLNLSLPREHTENVSSKTSVGWHKMFRGLGQLVGALRRHRPDLVYVKVSGDRSCFRELFYMTVIRMFTRARIIMHFHGMFKEYGRDFPFIGSRKHRWLNRTAINALFRAPHRSIFLSPVILEDFFPVLTPGNRAKATAVEHFVDVSFFDGPRPDPDGDTHVLFVGRMSLEKGFFEMLEAIPAVRERFPRTVFHVCGAPETADALDQVRPAMDRLQEEGALVLHGLVAGETKQAAFARADIMLFPTHNEIFPNVVLEGMARGLPLVTTRAGVIASVVEDGVNGFLVEIGDAASVTQALLRLLEDPELRSRMAQANRAKAEARFDISVSVDRLTELFSAELERL